MLQTYLSDWQQLKSLIRHGEFAILILYWREYEFSIYTLESDLAMYSNTEDVPILLHLFIDIPPMETITMRTNLPLK